VDVADSGDVLGVYFKAVWTVDLPEASTWWDRGWDSENDIESELLTRLDRNPNLAKSIKKFLRNKYQSISSAKLTIGEDPWLNLETDGDSHCTLTVRTTVRNDIVIPGIPLILNPLFTWGHRFDIRTFDYIYSTLLHSTVGRKLDWEAWPEPQAEEYDEDDDEEYDEDEDDNYDGDGNEDYDEDGDEEA